MSTDSGMDRPIAAVVVTFRRPRHLAVTLRHLLAQHHPLARIVVVDNGGDDGARAALAMLRDVPVGGDVALEVLQAPSNPGFGAGLQVGIDHLQARHPEIWAVLTCDDDSTAPPELLGLAAAVMRADDDVGMVTTKPATDRVTGLQWGGRALPRVGLVDHALLRAAALEHVTFRDDLFMMLEDVDLSRRLRRAGWQIAVVDVAVDREYLGAAGNPPWRGYYQTRNEVRIALDSHRPRDVVAAMMRLGRHLAVSVYIGLSQRDPGHLAGMLAARARGVLDGLRGRMGRHPQYPGDDAPAAVAVTPADGGDPVTRVAIVVPVRNERTRLPQQIDALRAEVSADAGQRRVEFVVADNGSTDDTVAVARRALAGLPHARVIDASARPGAAAARNIAVAALDADAFLFTDADDVVEPGWLRAHLLAFDQGADVTLGAWYIPQRNGSRERAETHLELWGRPYALGANHGVRRRVFGAVGGYSEDIGFIEDAEFSWRCEDAGFRLVPVPDAVIRRSIPVGAIARFRRHLAYGRGQRGLIASGRAPLRPMVIRWRTLKQLAWLVLHGHHVLTPATRADWCGRVGRALGVLLPSGPGDGPGRAALPQPPT